MHASKSRPGLLNYVVLLIFVIPLAVLAAGVGAFLGMTVAVAGWGPALLNVGGLVGVGVSWVLLLAWVIVFVVAREPKSSPSIHVQKVTSFVEDMKCRGVDPKVAAPILFRLWWNLGFQAPPPMFLGMWANFAWSFAVFAIVIVDATAIFWWNNPNASLWSIWLTVLSSLVMLALLFAYGAAAADRSARKYQFPPWDDYSPAPPPSKTSSND